MRLTKLRLQALEAEFEPRFTPSDPALRQYCLMTGAAPQVSAFVDGRGILTGVERIHWFGHHSVDLINRAGTQLLNGQGRLVIERSCLYGAGSLALVYFAGRTEASFEAYARIWWQNFNEYLDGATDHLIHDPFCRVAEARQRTSAAL
jgi:hypothetical protein